MRILFLLALAASPLAACSSGSQADSGPSPATVRIDSTGAVVDTATSQ